MPITISGSGTVTGISTGGLPDNTVDGDTISSNSVNNAKLADDAVDSAEIADGAVDLAHLSATGTKSGSTFLAGDNSWKTVSGTTIENNADQKVLTGSGSANTISTEPNIYANSDRLMIGGNSPQTVYASVNTDALQIQTDNTDYQKSSMSLQYFRDNLASPSISFAKSKNNTLGSHTAVNDTTNLGAIRWMGSDGDEFRQAFAIQVQTDGTVADNVVPARLHLYTQDEGNNDGFKERIRITDKGNVYIHGGLGHNSDNGESHGYYGHDANRLTITYKSTSSVIPNGYYGIGIWDHNGGTSTYAMYFRNGSTNAGHIMMNNNTTTFNTSSDYRLKENQVAISDSVTEVKKLKPYRFNWKNDPSGPKVMGFFAHEVAEVCPQGVSGTKDKVMDNGEVDPQGFDYGTLTPLLTAALQEALAKIEVLEAKVAALEAA